MTPTVYGENDIKFYGIKYRNQYFSSQNKNPKNRPRKTRAYSSEFHRP
jgi:hypothetical protein